MPCGGQSRVALLWKLAAFSFYILFDSAAGRVVCSKSCCFRLEGVSWAWPAALLSFSFSLCQHLYRIVEDMYCIFCHSLAPFFSFRLFSLLIQSLPTYLNSPSPCTFSVAVWSPPTQVCHPSFSNIFFNFIL